MFSFCWLQEMRTTAHCCNSVSVLLNPKRSHGKNNENSKLQPKLIALDSSYSSSSSSSHYHRSPRDHLLLSLLDDYNKSNLDMASLKQIHALMLRRHLFSSPYLYSACKLLTVCSLSSFSNEDNERLAYALRMFDQITQPNLYFSNIIFRGHSSLYQQTSILLFSRLLLQHHLLPNNFTFPFILKATARLSDIRFGTALHGIHFPFS